MNKVAESEINITPISGNVIIKKTIKEYPIIAIGNNKQPDGIGDVNYYIAGFSAGIAGVDFKLGQEVYISDAALSNRLKVKGNLQSYNELNRLYSNMKGRELAEAMQLSKSVTTIDYFLVHNSQVDGLIN